MKTKLTKAYDDGYITGLNWKDNYRPGGPIVFHPLPNDKTETIEMCKQSKAENEAYLKGFDDGLAYQRKIKGELKL